MTARHARRRCSHRLGWASAAGGSGVGVVVWLGAVGIGVGVWVDKTVWVRVVWVIVVWELGAGPGWGGRSVSIGRDAGGDAGGAGVVDVVGGASALS